MKFYVVMTNLKTGRAEYVHVKDLKAGMDYLLATSVNACSFTYCKLA